MVSPGPAPAEPISKQGTLPLPGTPPRFIALDSLRGVAALGVVTYHLRQAAPVFDNAISWSAWLFVDFFFVLSGFVIAANYGDRLAGGFPVTRFMALRLGRLYPLHLFVVALYFGLELARYFGGQPTAFTGQKSIPLLLLSLAMLQGLFPEGKDGWSGASWSISVEMWLYAGMAGLWRLFGTRAWTCALALSFGVATAFACGFNQGPGPLSNLLLRGVLGFGLGVLAWRVWPSSPMGRIAPWLATAGELAVVVMALAAMTSATAPLHIVLSDLCFFLAVLCFASERGAIARLLVGRIPVLLGTLSYSIYLLHEIAIAAGIRLFHFLGLAHATYSGAALDRHIGAAPLLASMLGLALCLACIGLAALTYRFIEKPARAWSRRVATPIAHTPFHKPPTALSEPHD